MVTNNAKRNDSVVRVSKWLDDAVSGYISGSNSLKLEFPSKRNFVDKAVLKLLEERGVELNGV